MTCSVGEHEIAFGGLFQGKQCRSRSSRDVRVSRVPLTKL